MRFLRTVLWAGALCLVSAAQPQSAQPQSSGQSTPVIRTETRLVLVDTVVTDKKGHYLRDLEAKEFRVLEDNKEQTITSFSRESDANSPSGPRPRYLILFFDNSTMDQTVQMYARQAATKFIDANLGPNRLMAVVDFGGSMRMLQNFTASAERLKRAVGGARNSPGPAAEVASTNLPALGDASTYLSGAASDFSARTGLLALRSLAKGLASVPGRKILILFSAGFVLNADNRPELTAAIDACNKANVAIYPIDARGLVADAPGKQSAVQYPDHSYVKLASYIGPSFAFAQRGGAGGGGKPAPGGGTSGGAGGGAGGRAGGSPGGVAGGVASGARGNIGGTTGRAPSPGAGGRTYSAPGPTVDQRVIIPPFPPSASTNQQVLYMLADGTGGFVIVNTNDLVGGLEKIAKEQDEYYLLGYSAPESKEGSCHTLRVKVNRGGTVVRARSGYCNAKPLDALAGNPTAKDLEGRAASSLPGTVAASMQAPFFYTSRNTARVNVAIDIASAGLKFEKVKGKFHSEVNVLGIIYTPNGSIAARFSDAVKIDLDDKQEVEAFHQQPLHYENQFEAAAGQYNLKVVFSAGREGFGKVEMPLVIEPYDGKHFAMSAVVLSNRTVAASGIDAGLDAALLEDQKPLLSQGWRIVPSGANRLKKTGTAVVYVEVYEPVLPGPDAPTVALQIRVVDRKTGQEKFDSGLLAVNDYGRPGSPVIPIGLTLAPALQKLAAGPYRAEVKAVDSLGNSSAVRLADFEVE